MTYTDISDLDLALALHEVKCLPYLAHEVVEYKVLEEDRDLYEGLMDDLADLYYEDEDEVASLTVERWLEEAEEEENE